MKPEKLRELIYDYASKLAYKIQREAETGGKISTTNNYRLYGAGKKMLEYIDSGGQQCESTIEKFCDL